MTSGNPYHDEKGRFTDGPSGGGESLKSMQARFAKEDSAKADATSHKRAVDGEKGSFTFNSKKAAIALSKELKSKGRPARVHEFLNPIQTTIGSFGGGRGQIEAPGVKYTVTDVGHNIINPWKGTVHGVAQPKT